MSKRILFWATGAACLGLTLLAVGCSAGTTTRNANAPAGVATQPTPAQVSGTLNQTATPSNQTAASDSNQPVAAPPAAPGPPVGQKAAPPNAPVMIPPPVSASATPRRGPPPTPEISTGGNDLFLFKNVRALLDGTSEVPGAQIIINLKDGAVVLTGTVDNATQKARAEQLVKQVSGVKSVKNELRVKG